MLPRIPLRPGQFIRAVLLTTTTLALLHVTPALAQSAMQQGEAYVTRFSGTKPGAGGAVISTEGTVGSIIDLRAPRTPPLGQHWVDEPQRQPVTAGQVGQVFGVTLDDANPPNVYLSATSAFGLHRTGNDWMPGMWGQDGGPGTIYRLDASTGYQPRAFAQINLNGRPNSGASLGNIAYDKTNKQLFVSDLESGMIHRIRAADGADLGHFDHGTQGRASFVKGENGERASLTPIAFNPTSRARVDDCTGKFDNTPQCWNFAASGRRIWGLGVRHDAVKNETRLFYAVWSSPAFGPLGWNQASEDDKRNSVWSIRLTSTGAFDLGDVRREFVMPDFFNRSSDIARAGYSQPVSDIAFSECGQRPVMLVAERGGIRNLGLDAENAFANPHEARALRYEVDANGRWRPIGRYDVGFYNRSKEGAPYMQANCSGGIAFGLGYNESAWTTDPAKPDQFVWKTGDTLCSAEGPCHLSSDRIAATGTTAPQPVAATTAVDASEVHGLQGLAEGAFEEVAPEGVFGAAGPAANAGGRGPNQAYMIDTDVNVDGSGQVIEQSLTSNDATRIGDIAVYQRCEPPRSYTYVQLTPPPAHPAEVSHARMASHGRDGSHYRFGSHDPYWSHSRWGSHGQFWSHWSRSSHSQERSHWRHASSIHNWVRSHETRRSIPHNVIRSHETRRSLPHDTVRSHERRGSIPHDSVRSHETRRSLPHDTVRSHERRGSIPHDSVRSHETRRSVPHSTEASHNRDGSIKTHKPVGSHTRPYSHYPISSHGQTVSHNRNGSGIKRPHLPAGSHAQPASHNRSGSNAVKKTISTGSSGKGSGGGRPQLHRSGGQSLMGSAGGKRTILR